MINFFSLFCSSTLLLLLDATLLHPSHASRHVVMSVYTDFKFPPFHRERFLSWENDWSRDTDTVSQWRSQLKGMDAFSLQVFYWSMNYRFETPSSQSTPIRRCPLSSSCRGTDWGSIVTYHATDLSAGRVVCTSSQWAAKCASITMWDFHHNHQSSKANFFPLQPQAKPHWLFGACHFPSAHEKCGFFLKKRHHTTMGRRLSVWVWVPGWYFAAINEWCMHRSSPSSPYL